MGTSISTRILVRFMSKDRDVHSLSLTLDKIFSLSCGRPNQTQTLSTYSIIWELFFCTLNTVAIGTWKKNQTTNNEYCDYFSLPLFIVHLYKSISIIPRFFYIKNRLNLIDMRVWVEMEFNMCYFILLLLIKFTFTIPGILNHRIHVHVNKNDIGSVIVPFLYCVKISKRQIHACIARSAFIVQQ